MTFKPTAANKKRWIKKFLNGGVCPRDRREWDAIDEERYYACLPQIACLSALEWLARTDIQTLEEAWDRCKIPSYLLWTLQKMQPTAKDRKLAYALIEYLKLLKFPTSFTDRLNEDLDQLENVAAFNLKETTPHWERVVPSPTDLLDMLTCEFHWEETDVQTHKSKTSPAQLKKVAVKIKELWGNPWILKRGKK